MKKSFVMAAIALLATLTIGLNAAERGKFIHVDSSVNKNLKPQLAFCQEHKDGKDVTTLLVHTVNVNAYNEFTEASRVLLAFADGKKVRLNRTAGSQVSKKKHTEKKGNATISFFSTETMYDLTPEVLDELKNGVAITKVRIVFKENDAKDYEIADGYQEKMRADLLKSYLEAEQKNKAANNDMSDEDF